MTMPDERTQAVIQVGEFLKTIRHDPSIPEAIRQQASMLLRHYPSRQEMQHAGKLEEHFAEITLLAPVFGIAQDAMSKPTPVS